MPQILSDEILILSEPVRCIQDFSSRTWPYLKKKRNRQKKCPNPYGQIILSLWFSRYIYIIIYIYIYICPCSHNTPTLFSSSRPSRPFRPFSSSGSLCTVPSRKRTSRSPSRFPRCGKKWCRLAWNDWRIAQVVMAIQWQFNGYSMAIQWDLTYLSMDSFPFWHSNSLFYSLRCLRSDAMTYSVSNGPTWTWALVAERIPSAMQTATQKVYESIRSPTN